MIELDQTFAAGYVCEVLEELPGNETARRCYFPEQQRSGQDGVIARVSPVDGDPWIGMFAFGKFGGSALSGIFSMPDPGRLCVVARGAGHVVSVRDPRTWEPVGVKPIIDVRPVLAAGLLVLADFTEMLAYGASGVRWRTKRLSWDNLRILVVGDKTLVGEYWDIRDEALREFEVDLETGDSRGGVET